MTAPTSRNQNITADGIHTLPIDWLVNRCQINSCGLDNILQGTSSTVALLEPMSLVDLDAEALRFSRRKQIAREIATWAHREQLGLAASVTSVCVPVLRPVREYHIDTRPQVRSIPRYRSGKRHSDLKDRPRCTSNSKNKFRIKTR